jgi:ElaB/YqjD/DUF883 family membrane-anchored ribosome-binding protein
MTALSQQLEQKAEQNRARLAETLDELRERVTPGQVLDELLDYAGNGTGGEIVRTLLQQVQRNPLSVALVGAGLAWLMLSNQTANRVAEPRSRLEDADRNAAARLAALSDHPTGSSSVGDLVTSTYRRAQAATSDMARRAHSSADSAYRGAGGALSEATDRASDTAAAMSRNAAAPRRTLADLLHDQPLVIAGLGLALGAALGTLLPSTERERQLVKRRAQGLATKIYQQTRSTVDADVNAATPQDQETTADPASHDPATVVPHDTSST